MLPVLSETPAIVKEIQRIFEMNRFAKRVGGMNRINITSALRNLRGMPSLFSCVHNKSQIRKNLRKIKCSRFVQKKLQEINFLRRSMSIATFA